MYDQTYDELLALLEPLAQVEQQPRFHPEGDALFHSLQVYQQACRDTGDPELLAAALLHDVGKALASPCHAETGAELLAGIASERVGWLVAHHLDLLRAPQQTRAQLAGEPRLSDLEALRRWDLAGRRPRALVPCAERCVGELLQPGAAEAWLTPTRIEEDGFEYGL